MAHPYWPLFDVEVRTPRLTLRYIDDVLATQLVDLIRGGIHDPSFMPFLHPFTDAGPDEIGPNSFRFWWNSRGATTPSSWNINFAVVVDGEPVGATSLEAADFPVLRQFETGSWLGRPLQGQGLGRELRIATLTFGFLGLDAEFATTGAWHDNDRSLGVTNALGYEPEGSRRAVRRGKPDTLLGFRMTRDHFAANIQREDIEIIGDEAARTFLGVER